jgi:VIT1/CCC1 family predicted Fe2+/Mn2+ transporter
VVSGLVLFAVGACTTLSLVGDWRRSGIQMLKIGLGAALIGYAISSAVVSIAS